MMRAQTKTAPSNCLGRIILPPRYHLISEGLPLRSCDMAFCRCRHRDNGRSADAAYQAACCHSADCSEGAFPAVQEDFQHTSSLYGCAVQVLVFVKANFRMCNSISLGGRDVNWRLRQKYSTIILIHTAKNENILKWEEKKKIIAKHVIFFARAHRILIKNHCAFLYWLPQETLAF